MTVLTVIVSTDYSATALNNITNVTFTPALAATATFLNTQFNNVAIRNNVLFTGEANLDGIIINGGTVDASGWLFNGWTRVLGDFVTINGSNIADTITDSVERDTINGRGGADIIRAGGGLSQGDTLNGGNANDTFEFSLTDDAITDTINGGAGTADVLKLMNAGNYDFTQAMISLVEQLRFGATAQTALMSGSDIAVGEISTIRGTAAANTLDVVGSVDLGAVVFTSWSVADTVILHGTDGNDTQTGTGFNDTFHGSAGIDTQDGGLGDDTFRFADLSSLDSSDTIDGGGGHDIVLLEGAGSYLLSRVDFSGVERLAIEGHMTVANLQPVQFGPTGFAEISGLNGATNNLTVLTNFLDPDIDLSDVIFSDWEDGVDSISFIGDNGINHMIGSALSDQFQDNGGADTLLGMGGDDMFIINETAYDPGLVLDGGDGARDSLAVLALAGDTRDLSAVTLASIELVEFSLASNSITLNDTQIGLPGTITIINNRSASFASNCAVIVNGSVIDLGALVFEEWNDASDDVLLNGTTGSDVLTGSGKRDEILAGDGDDTISGGGGDDIVDAGIGIDTVLGSSGADDLDGSSNTDTLDYSLSAAGVNVDIAANTASGGDAEGDTIASFERLVGSAFDDTLTGNSIANRITGGGGLDELTGGGAADVFDYNDASESTVALRDFITDFEDAALDKIDLIHVDADAVAAGNNTFALTATGGTGGFTGLGQLRYFVGTQNTTISMNISGDTAPDMQIVLAGLHTLDAADFVL
jgi:Ca2+-binding RTX toxin-like protein